MYQALYRKWRPKAFDDVVSQSHITTALKNQIASGKTAHAYLFTGSRGTGKTTCARIFAKAINCPDAADGEPCGECEICRHAENGTLSDIIEIDAASNAGVNDIRELRESVIYTPEMCSYKIYIIDEVHMLSPGAFNALLKTMEEPPPHVKFILTTTEVHKVPETIISRCQHFDFNRIKSEDIVSRLKFIASQEGFSIDDDAALMMARLSDGGMRDAISLLDRCWAYSDSITLEIVSNAAGIAGRDYLFDLLEKISAYDTAGAINAVDELHGKSKDLKTLCLDLLTMMRNLMLIKSTDDAGELITCMPEELERLKKIASTFTLDRIFDSITLLQQTSERFARASDKRIELEICMVRLCAKTGGTYTRQTASASDAQLNELKSQLDALTRAVSGSASPVQKPPANAQKATKPLSDGIQSVQKKKKKFSPSSFTPLKEWAEILEIIKARAPALWAFLKNSTACIDGDTFCVIVESEFFIKKFKASDDKTLLKQIVNDYYGKDFGFMLYSAANADIKEKESPTAELLDRARSMNIEVEIKN
ncbi:MAG: DNA polymerase III subunit gamma/tau [Ruminococcus sp.]|nr:DNA polymerase III subunit gamma/tau [Ruminococcus sp.]